MFFLMSNQQCQSNEGKFLFTRHGIKYKVFLFNEHEVAFSALTLLVGQQRRWAYQRSGNIVGRINEVTLRRARLVLGWVTIFGG